MVGEVTDKVVDVGVKTVPLHAFTRLFALTEPNPVARSNPAPAEYAMVPVIAPVFGFKVSSIPRAADLEFVLLQPWVPPIQGTELFPKITSLNTQLTAGPLLVPGPFDELQFAGVCAAARGYST